MANIDGIFRDFSVEIGSARAMAARVHALAGECPHLLWHHAG
jgi:hypothetical protein